MKIGAPTFACATALLMLAGPAWAEPSDYVSCDGRARTIKAGEGFGRFLLQLGTLGVAGTPESDDGSLRQSGQLGAAACTRAMEDGQGKNDLVRRSDLLAARAIHYLEADETKLALADLDQFPQIGGALASTQQFRRSIDLRARQLRALAYLKSGAIDQAVKVTEQLIADYPYNLATMSLYLDIQDIAPTISTPKYDIVSKHSKLNLVYRLRMARLLAANGLYGDALRQLEILTAGLGDDLTPQVYAEAALYAQLASEPARATAQESIARSKTDLLAAQSSSDSVRMAAIARADEMLAFGRVVSLMRESKWTEARRQFAQRDRWLVPPAKVVRDVAQRLRASATPEEMTGSLANDPQAVFDTYREARIKLLTNKDSLSLYFSRFWGYEAAGIDDAMRREVWDITSKSVVSRKTDDTPGVTYTMSKAGGGENARLAVTLHTALRARAAGKTGFIVLKNPFLSGTMTVQFVGPDDKDVAPERVLDVASVIEELSGLFSAPATAGTSLR